MRMNIFAPHGTKIVFANPDNGYTSDKELVKRYLTVGGIYVVHHTEVGSSYTKVILEGFPGIKFNSVMFNDYVEDSKMKPQDVQIIVMEECDGFEIRIHDKSFRFSQEENLTKLPDVFKELGFTNVHYEEVY